jgi:hypothetical protein
MSQKDLLNLREKKDVYFIQNIDTPRQTLCGLCGFARKTLNPPRRTGQVYADLRRKKTQIRRLSQKDLLNLREKKDFYFIQNVDTPQQFLCVSESLREEKKNIRRDGQGRFTLI